MHCKEIYTCCLGVDLYFTGISVRIFLKPEKIAKFSKAQRKLAVLERSKTSCNPFQKGFAWLS